MALSFFALTFAVIPDKSSSSISNSISTPKLFVSHEEAVEFLFTDFVLSRIIECGAIDYLSEKIPSIPGVAGIEFDGDEFESADEWLCNLPTSDLRAWALSQTADVMEKICDEYFDFEDGDDTTAFYEIAEVGVTLPANSAAALVKVTFDGPADSVDIRDGVHQAVDIAVEHGFLTAGNADEGPTYVGHAVQQL